MLKRTAAEGSGEAAEAAAALERIGRAGNWIDFDDLVALPAALLEAHADIAARLAGRAFAHVVADEFQDIDEQQYRLLRLLAGDGRHLAVIGDPDQAIYGFRGADAACFARFAQDFPAATTLRLARNYRSSGTIARAAAHFVGAADGGVTRPAGEPIVLHAAADAAAEAEFVAVTIEELLGGHDMLAANRGHDPSARPLGFADCAVLYRTDAEAGALRAAFDRAGIPFAKSSPAPIAGHAGVQAILDRLAADHPLDIAAAAEVARRAGTADAAALAEAKGWLAALAAGAAVAGDRARLGEAVALSTEADFHDARADRVSLLTMHAAKGLEFPVVFVVGHGGRAGAVLLGGEPGRTRRTAAEERRLFYVAMTRAKDRLFLSRGRDRFWRGAPRALPPSPFLAEIAADLTVSDVASRRTRRQARQLSLF